MAVGLVNARIGRQLVLLLGAAAAAFLVYWIGFGADRPAVEDPNSFVYTLLDGISISAVYFIVASGFTLMFGLMRVVNMAHGSLFLLGAYVALTLQQHMVGVGSEEAVNSSDATFVNWVLPALAGAGVAAIVGLLIQQTLLRWNQGQDLRQALITIAVSIIAADQLLAHFGGIAKNMTWPNSLNDFVDFHVHGILYTRIKLFILALAIVIGALLWIWLKRTRTGMVIRAGVDDRAMVSALGVNIQLVFAAAFLIGSALAGFGGAVWASQAGVAPGTDGSFLLHSLVVVIIGGMGSLGGAAVGSLLYGLVGTLAQAYLPGAYSSYSIIFTFMLLAVVLALRPTGLFGREA